MSAAPAPSALPFSQGASRVYFYYRLTLAAVLLGMYYTGTASEVFGTREPRLYFWVTSAYALICVIAAVWLIKAPRLANLNIAVLSQFVVDLIAVALMMHASGGLVSGMGLLMFPTVAAGSLIFTGQYVLFLPALATLLLLGEELSAIYSLGAPGRAVFPAGILGAMLFLTAVLFRALLTRLVRTSAIAERESKQAAHLQSLNETIVHRMQTGIVAVDEHQRIELINHAAVSLLGGGERNIQLCEGGSLKSVATLHQGLLAWREQPWRRLPPFKAEHSDVEVQARFTRLNRSEDHATIIFLEDTRAAAESAQRLKLASLGRLAGSIAHEIRNPLSAIDHAAQLLAESPGTGAPSRRLIDIIIKHSTRLDQIVENVSRLSRRQAPKTESLSLDSWLKGFVSDFRESYPEDCEVEIRIDTPKLQIIFDPSHLQQVLTNLLENGLRHSRESRGDAWVEFRIYHNAQNHRPCLDIYDRGPGIDAQTAPLIFEPFYTTSATGTGLGLFLARELCEINSATLNYHPAATQGSGFFRISFAHPQQRTQGEQYD